MVTVRACIELHEAAERARTADRPVRVIRALVMLPDGWDAFAGHARVPRLERRGYCDLAALGRRLDVPVGRVLEP